MIILTIVRIIPRLSLPKNTCTFYKTFNEKIEIKIKIIIIHIAASSNVWVKQKRNP